MIDEQTNYVYVIRTFYSNIFASILIRFAKNFSSNEQEINEQWILTFHSNIFASFLVGFARDFTNNETYLRRS
jgi:fluoride ion exporter CrcB/FEX